MSLSQGDFFDNPSESANNKQKPKGDFAMDFYKRACELMDETVSHRRFFHENAETGLQMPMAREYIKKNLLSLGIAPQDCGHGISALIGNGEKTILLRADMDALPTSEESGVPFECKNGNAHTCGHDLHAAMLLTAAKILKECEDSLCGSVKLMFQPAEETLEGCADMVSSGILQNPEVSAALAFHITSGRIPIGTVMYNSTDAMMNSADVFRIEVMGRGGHGAYPNLTVDPIYIATMIYSALTTLPIKESDPSRSCIISIGRLCGGETANVIPDTAVIEGSLRTDYSETRNRIIKRIGVIAESIAKAHNAKAKLTFLSQIPPLMCDKELTEEMLEYIKDLSFGNINTISGMKAGASEDFAIIAQSVPSTMLYFSAGFMDERGDFAQHNPKVLFNEEALPLGAASYAACAYNWLKNNAEKQ